MQTYQFPDGTRYNALTKEEFLWSLGYAVGVAVRDWGLKHPDIKLWENRYTNMIIGLNVDNIRKFGSLSREERIQIIEKSLSDGNALDEINDHVSVFESFDDMNRTS